MERRLLTSTVDGVLRMSAERVPRRNALRYADRTWTYAELDAAVTTGAAVLRERYGLAEETASPPTGTTPTPCCSRSSPAPVPV